MPRFRTFAPVVLTVLILLLTTSVAQTHTQAPNGNSPRTAENLAMGQWRFVTIGQTAINAVGRQQPYLKFEGRNNTVTGFTGCNRLHGRYDASDSTLTFHEVATTKMACASDNREEDVLKVINLTSRYEIVGDQLHLLGPSGTLAVLTRPHEEQTLRSAAPEK